MFLHFLSLWKWVEFHKTYSSGVRRKLPSLFNVLQFSPVPSTCCSSSCLQQFLQVMCGERQWSGDSQSGPSRFSLIASCSQQKEGRCGNTFQGSSLKPSTFPVDETVRHWGHFPHTCCSLHETCLLKENRLIRQVSWPLVIVCAVNYAAEGLKFMLREWTLAWAAWEWSRSQATCWVCLFPHFP